jgi:hypothetical protein
MKALVKALKIEAIWGLLIRDVIYNYYLITYLES